MKTNEEYTDNSWEPSEFLVARGCEVVAVAVVGAGLGMLLGGLTGLILGVGGPSTFWLEGGAVLGAVTGWVLEIST